MSSLEENNIKTRGECIKAKNFNTCTHVFVKKSTRNFVCPTGLYEYRLNGFLYEDKLPIINAKPDKLLSELSNNTIELLTHEPTLDKIREDQLNKQNNV